MSALVRRRVVVGILGLLACLAGAAPSVASAEVGRYTYMLCANPDTGIGTGSDGLFPDGVTLSAGHIAMTGLEHQQRCSGTITGSRGMIIKPSGSYTLAQQQGSTLTLTLPSDLRFVEAGLSMRTSTVGGLIAAVVRSSSDWIYASPWYYRCEQPGWNCLGTGSSTPFAPENFVGVGLAHSDMPNGFKWSLRCSSWQCSASDAAGFAVYGGKVKIADDAGPSGQLGIGALGSRDQLRGEEDVTFAASDGESGVYRARLLVDDQPQPWFVVDGGNPTCRDNNFGNSDDYEFSVRRPCPARANGVASLDTTKVIDGTHNVKLVVEDAAGRQVRLMDRDVSIDNVSAPVVASAPTVVGSPRRGSSLFNSAGTWTNGGAPGEPAVVRAWQRCLRDGSACQAIPGANSALYLPTDADLNRRLRVVETATNYEGSTQALSDLTAVITREDGSLPADNNGVDDDGDGQVDEPGEEKPATAGPQGPTTDSASSLGAKALSSRDSAKPATPATGAAGPAMNGEGASAQAKLTATFAKGAAKSSVGYGSSAVAGGRLVGEHGRPIRNAIIDVAEVQALEGARAASGRPVVTDADGAFSYIAPSTAGTRAITFAYRHQREGVVVAQATVQLTVQARVQLKVTLQGVVARYSGRVLAGAMPRAGKLVVVQGRPRGGRWQTFAARRASRTGAFKGQYRLKVRRPGKRLQFRVRVLTESGWNFTGVTSRAVTRQVR